MHNCCLHINVYLSTHLTGAAEAWKLAFGGGWVSQAELGNGGYKLLITKMLF